MTDFIEATVFGVIVLAVLLVIWVMPDMDRDIDRDMDRACTLAAGNIRSTLPWLAPGHPRRDAGLLLLSRDAAWAPVCARDPGAGARLRSAVDSALAQPDAPDAAALASQLIVLLENR